jgi:hypothetical protein
MTAPAFETRPGPKGDKYKALAEFMREHPGTWVKVRTAANANAAWSGANQIKTGRRAAFRPASDFEAYTEGPDIIARYVGAGTEDCPECHGHVKAGSYCPACGLSNHGETA